MRKGRPEGRPFQFHWLVSPVSATATAAAAATTAATASTIAAHAGSGSAAPDKRARRIRPATRASRWVRPSQSPGEMRTRTSKSRGRSSRPGTSNNCGHHRSTGFSRPCSGRQPPGPARCRSASHRPCRSRRRSPQSLRPSEWICACFLSVEVLKKMSRPHERPAR